MTAENQITVIKRNGVSESLLVEKYDKVCNFACDGIAQVSASELALRAYDRLYNNITTKQIHEILVSTAVDLITDRTPQYDHVASRLVNFGLRKEVYGSYEIPSLLSIIKNNISLKKYTPEILQWYTEEEIEEIESFIDHNRDEYICYAGMEQFRQKYIVQDRSKKKLYETPQIRYIIVAMSMMAAEQTDRLLKIKQYYDVMTMKRISIPTPINAGMGTPIKQFSSCTLVPVLDNLDSINAAAASIVKYVSKKAGIGVDMGRIRALGASVGSGEVTHTGVIPFIKYMRGALKSCSQGGVRGAAATVSYPWWHYEFEELIVLKNNKGTEETRERHVDYAVQIDDFFLDLVDSDEDVYVFCPKDAVDLQFAFYSGNKEKFKEEYYKAINDPNIRSKNIGSARSVVLGLYLSERHSTGRIYCQNMTTMVNNGPFKDLVQDPNYWLTSNLCLEIALPVEGFDNINTPEGMIALCTLSSVNWGQINKVEDLELPCRMSVRALDNLLTYQEYPVKQAETFVKRFRALGVGIVGLAHFLAKRGLKYNIDAVSEVDKYMEAMAYYLTDESVRLAEERGSCEWSDKTCYGKGVFPWELRNKNVDLIVPHETRFDWEELRVRMKKFGIRNATLMAVAPTESSAQLLGETNGIEPPVAPVTIKSSKDGLLKTVVPGIQRLKNKYDYRWDQKNPRGYLTIMAVLQKWIDQSISSNTSYNPEHYPDQQIKMSDLIKDFVYAMRIGIKTLYYDNTNDGSGESDDKEVVDLQQVEDDSKCDACNI